MSTGVTTASPKPIYSSHEDDPELRDPINDFVIGLAERVDLLQDAEATNNLTELGRLCAELSAISQRLGYDPLVEAARRVDGAARDNKREDARLALENLTDVSHRIRLGHRGAA